MRFVFYRDPAFWLGCTAYSCNRWVMHASSAFFRGHFNDLWLIPCALPLLLWLHDQMGWRLAGPPRPGEVAAHLVGWSALFEWVGPSYLSRATGDGWDVVCYAAGGLAALAWWRRQSRRGVPA